MKYFLFCNAAAENFQPLSFKHDLQFPGGMGEGEVDVIHPPRLYVWIYIEYITTHV